MGPPPFQLRLKMNTSEGASEAEASTSSEGMSCCSKSASYSRAWRKRIKENDPETWKKFKEAEAARHRERRMKRTDLQKVQDRKMGKIRQQKFIEKQRNKAKESDEKLAKKPGQVLTRSEKIKKREYNKKKKQESRARRNPQHVRRDKEKDAKRKRKERAAKTKNRASGSKKFGTPETNSAPETPSGYKSSSARRKALSRLWSHVPKDSEKFADIVEDFISGTHTTPKKKAALKKRGLFTRSKKTLHLMNNSVRERLQTLKKKKDAPALAERRLLVSAHLISKKYRQQNLLANALDVRPSYLSRVSKMQEENLSMTTRKRRCNATSMELIQTVQQFYQNPKISREMPYMATVKNQVQKRLMEVTIQQAYKMWQEDNEEENAVSYSLFQKLRPSTVLLQRQTQLNQCLCPYCTNILFKLQALNRISNAYKIDIKIKNKYKLIDITMCPKESDAKMYQLQCIERRCEKCGTKLLREMFADFAGHLEEAVYWLNWSTETYMHDGKQKTKHVKQTKRGKITDLLKQLLDETETLSKHLFTANWQQDMFSRITKNVPQHTVILVSDFAENYRCISQDEIQSAHWAIQQVTLHPIVAFYNCRCSQNDASHISQEALVFVSPDLKHDHHAVHQFERLALNHLKETRGLTFSNVVEFTDGASSQYKSRGPFADISYIPVDFGVQYERHYFGSRHGKGPSDGVSGVVKSAVRRAVISRQAIVNNAEQMFSYCERHLTKEDCTRQRRTFFLVKNVDRDRPERKVKNAVAGTRNLHAVKSVAPGVIKTRLLSCFCEGCLLSQSHCINRSHVPPWKRQELKMEVPPILYEPEVVVASEEIECEESLDALFAILQSDYCGDKTLPVSEDAADPSTNEEVLTLSDIMNVSPKSLPSAASAKSSPNTASIQKSAPSTASLQSLSSTDSMKYKVGDYVVVIYNNTWYPGDVTKVDGSMCKVSFMTKTGENKFVWPDTPEILEVETTGIFLRLLQPPAPVSNRYLGFDEKEYQRVTLAVKNYLKNI